MQAISAIRLGLASSALIAVLIAVPAATAEANAPHETYVASGITYAQLYRDPRPEYWNPEETDYWNPEALVF